MPWRMALSNNSAILRAVAVTAFCLPIRAEWRRQNAPRAVSLRPIVTAARRRSAVARLEDRRVREDSSLPPDILLPGLRQSHDVKCFALFQARRSVPHSATSYRASDRPRVTSVMCGCPLRVEMRGG